MKGSLKRLLCSGVSRADESIYRWYELIWQCNSRVSEKSALGDGWPKWSAYSMNNMPAIGLLPFIFLQFQGAGGAANGLFGKAVLRRRSRYDFQKLLLDWGYVSSLQSENVAESGAGCVESW